MSVGDWVRCERSRPPAGTWVRHADRVGRVVQVNPRDREVAVAFTANDDGRWFRPDELTPVTRPQGAPAIRTHAERAQIARNAETGTGSAS